MSKAKHGVLYYSGNEGDFIRYPYILTIENKQWSEQVIIDDPHFLQDAAELALKYRITHLWIHPNYSGFPADATNHDEWSFKVMKNRAGNMMEVSVWKRGTGHVNIIFPQYTSWRNCGWIENATPKEHLVTLAYLEQVLGVTVSGSAASTGWSYLKTIHAAWVEDIPGVDLVDLHFRGSSDVIVWQRPLLSIERKRKYLHKHDKNMDFPNAATTSDIGVGTPYHVDNGDEARHEKGHPQAVGVWRCTIKKTVQSWMSAGNVQEWEEGESWIAGPIIRLLRVAGYEVEIHEGWVFPERHDVMTKWGNDMWKFRNMFRDKTQWKHSTCAAFAEKAVKRMAVATIGVTAFRGFEEENEKRRPDIRGQIIAREREVMWHNIEKIRKLYGLTPVMVYADAVYYLSDNPDGRAVLSTLTERENKLGGLKYEGHIEMTPQLLDMFDESMPVWKRLEILNKIGWSK